MRLRIFESEFFIHYVRATGLMVKSILGVMDPGCRPGFRNGVELDGPR